jgi:hypothetical protein
LNQSRLLGLTFLIVAGMLLLFSYLPIPSSMVPSISTTYKAVESNVHTVVTQNPTPITSLAFFIFTNNLKVLIGSSIPVVGFIVLGIDIFNTAAVLHVVSSSPTSFSISTLVVAISLFGYPHSVLELLAYCMGSFPTLYFLVYVRKRPLPPRLAGLGKLPSRIFPTAGYMLYYIYFFTLFFLAAISVLAVAALLESILIVITSFYTVLLLWPIALLVLAFVFSSRLHSYFRVNLYTPAYRYILRWSRIINRRKQPER